ncbi:hypothetical protein JOC77_001891 [Peribacillus deserti]|uniref:Uncharacterized protein n=1 Tax=Peribacillus deserti TaxID=673318 RepID=A0ABS2QH18_9BACI|nr:hypothetical protein [Peribacillus deserti]MBM7692461.1 hypothetical protein [Peribacillus deserti]
MCFSTDSIEQRTKEMFEEIRLHSIFPSVTAVSSTGDNPFVAKVILRDSNGTSYFVEPNESGLQFARGEITYKEYKKIERKGNIFGIESFSVIVASFFLMFWALSSYVL